MKINPIIFSIDRELAPDEIAELESNISVTFPGVRNVKVKPMHSMGMTGTELLISVAVSFSTSITANAAYDLGKFVVSYLLKRGVKSNKRE